MECIEDFDSVIGLVEYFDSEAKCLEYLEVHRWGGDVHCPHCGMDKTYRFSDGVRYKCASCLEQFTAKVGTIFESSKIPMVKWYMAIYFVNNHKKGISSHQLARDLKVTQKTAWFMLQRIRYALGQDETEQMDGVVEIDETFVGGKNKNRHKSKKVKNSQGRSFKDKTPVLGMMERGGKLKTIVIKDTKGTTIQPIIKKSIKKGAILMTDEWYAYKGLGVLYEHNVVDHGRGQYVADGGVYTNNIEGFWSWVKRAIIGIYHRISPRHLQLYIDEITFRYNTRFYSASERMKLFISLINKRLKYNSLKAIN